MSTQVTNRTGRRERVLNQPEFALLVRYYDRRRALLEGAKKIIGKLVPPRFVKGVRVVEVEAGAGLDKNLVDRLAGLVHKAEKYGLATVLTARKRFLKCRRHIGGKGRLNATSATDESRAHPLHVHEGEPTTTKRRAA